MLPVLKYRVLQYSPRGNAIKGSLSKGTVNKSAEISIFKVRKFHYNVTIYSNDVVIGHNIYHK